MSDVGKHIRQYRQERKLTQDALAEKLHVTRQAVSNWETGKNQPDLDMLAAIAGALEVGPAELLEESRPGYPRFQRKAVIWASVLGVVALFLLCDRIFLAPYLLKLRGQTFNIWPDLVNALVVVPLCRIAAGMLIPAAVSLWRDVRLSERLRTALRIVPFLLLLPMVLSWLGLVWPPLYRVTFYCLTDPTKLRLNLVFSLFPFLAGLGLYPAWCA